MMIRFNCDYTEGACPEILERLCQTNFEQTPGYGTDDYCQQAAQKILEACQAPQAAVHFLVGGTQANLTVISAVLRPHQCVVCAEPGHINVHETGAIEATGHKVVGLPSPDGKLTAQQVAGYWDGHWEDGSHEHIAQPKLVYISDSTELGAVYTKAELEALSQACRQRGMLLFLDGARLGYALAAQENDLTLPDLARLCDIFYIGGTKQGALFGEAVVICNPALQEDFRYLIKQRGGMLAKGRLLGLQFDTLFTDGLYLRLARQADQLAVQLRDALQELGCPMPVVSGSNQQFAVLPDRVLAELGKDYAYSHQGQVDPEHSLVRFCTSWATRQDQVDRLIGDLRRLCR